jgi:hypothetical protein
VRVEDRRVVMPKTLTAENGAKAAFMCEFEFRFGESMVFVPWTTIKEIYKAAVKLLGEPTPPAPEE